MIETVRWTARSWTTCASIICVLCISTLAVFVDSGSDRAAWVAGFNIARQTTVFLVPVYLGLIWGALGDAHADEMRQLAGVNPRTQRYRQTLVLAIFGAIAMAGIVLSYRLLTGRSTVPGLQSSAGEVAYAGTYFAITLAATILATTAVVVGRRRVPALTAALVLPVGHVVLVYGELPGRLLWLSVLPTTAGGFVARPDGNYPASLRVFAIISLSALVVMATYSIEGKRSGSRPARSWKPLARTRPGSVKSAWLGGGVAAVVLLGASAPLIIQDHLPWQSRPSLILQRVDGRAPEQVADLFFQYARQGDDARAVRLTSGGALNESIDRRLSLRQVSGATNFSMVASPDLLHSRVRGQIGSSVVCVDLVSVADGGKALWRVRRFMLGDCSDA